MLSTHILAISTLTLLANTQTIPTTTPATALSSSSTPPITPSPLPHTALQTPIMASVQKYYSSLTAQSEWTSAVQALTAAIPYSARSQIANDPTDYLRSVFGGTGQVPGWVSAMPTNYTEYFRSVVAAQASMTGQAAEGSAPAVGRRVRLVGAALAVGAAGFVLL